MSRREKIDHVALFKTYLRIVGYLRGYVGLVILSISLSILVSVLYFGSLGMIKPVMDILFEDGAESSLQVLYRLGSIGERIAEFLKKYLLYDKYLTLYWMMGTILAMSVVRNVLRFFQEYLGDYLTLRVLIDISNGLFYKVKELPASYFTAEGEGKVTARFVNDIHVMGTGVRTVLTKAICEPINALAALALAFVLHWQLTLLAACVIPPALWCIRSLAKQVKKSTKKTLAQRGNIQTILQETFQGIKTVKSYQMEDYLQRKFESENRKLLGYQMKAVVADTTAKPVMEIFITAAGMGVLFFASHLVFKGEMTSGGFCAFFAALVAFFEPMHRLANGYTRVSGSVGGAERVFSLLDQPGEVRDIPDAVPLPAFRDTIEFDNVSFAYRPGEPVLNDISFKAKKGEKIALVGPSGAGKSTLMSLLPRFYDVDRGTITIDGIDIRKVPLSHLRRLMSLVTQEAFLFHDTILANIVCSYDEGIQGRATQAAEAAYARQFIEKLPQSYGTHYGENHVDLSGGQKHRVALARAFFKGAEILILDEAMANLDAESEDYIQKAMEEIAQGRTTFVIAHRFSTIDKADRILVLNREGRLEAFGNHREVYASSSTYRTLYDQQSLHPPQIGNAEPK